MDYIQDQDACPKCKALRISGGLDCPVCGEPTDVCEACGSSLHDCRK